MSTVTAPANSYELSVTARVWAPILAGPMAGLRWFPKSGGKIVRVFFGTYEAKQTALFMKLVNPGDVLYDIGAACGYYTVLGSRLVGDTGSIVAFEPDPKNAAFSRAHVGINRLSNATVLETAVGDHVGQACFVKGTGTGTGRLTSVGDVSVALTTVDAIVESGQRAPTHMKIDVEGGEVDVLYGAKKTIETCRPTLFLSTHGSDVHDRCCELLRLWGYELSTIEGQDVETASELLCAPCETGFQINPTCADAA